MIESQEHVLEKKLKEQGRTKEALLKDVDILKEWMMTQPHLPEVMGSKKLENFLILNKFSTERAKEKIDNYYTIPTKLSDDMMPPQSPELQKSFEIAYFVALPQLTRDNYRVMFFKMRNKDRIDEMEPDWFINRGFHIQEIRLNDEYMFGDIGIIDAEGINLGYMTKITPVHLSKILACYEKIFSIPLKGLYILNASYIIETALKLLKTLIKPKLSQRIHVCTDTSILEDVLEKDMIPSDYGGKGQSLEEIQGTLKRKLIEYKDRFDQMANLKVDENLRPVKPKNDDLLGYYGSFKQINFD